eukprot:TRINITY_DN36283_c0_g1_i1.p1 TRINITY_DN36283_c0_g1~~TRINITY_DN36283_c0_g1_i1.p1  ORF type:complete len:111 (+),score=28.75 TRINITY_DN36283_c0_g1_i1:36-368(+)
MPHWSNVMHSKYQELLPPAYRCRAKKSSVSCIALVTSLATALSLIVPPHSPPMLHLTELSDLQPSPPATCLPHAPLPLQDSASAPAGMNSVGTGDALQHGLLIPPPAAQQ